MQDKQKVTLYIKPELHRQLKIQSAIDCEPMSEIAERAIGFYLDHLDVVEETEASGFGATHRVYDCPECTSPLVLRSGEMVSLRDQPNIIVEEDLSVPTRSSGALVSSRS
jgi:hypothetical protein